MAALAVHLPATLAAFGGWLAAHWPAGPPGYRWQYGHAVHHLEVWQLFRCHTSGQLGNT